jgi:hypothetical protein
VSARPRHTYSLSARRKTACALPIGGRRAPNDPAILGLVGALARWQARRDYSARQKAQADATQASDRRPDTPKLKGQME